MQKDLPDFKKEAAITPYIVHNDIELTDYGNGFCTGRIKIEARHKNLHGTVHGGCVFSLADTVAGYTAMTKGTIITTLNASINYLHPVIGTEYLICKGEIIKDGKTLTVVRTELFDDNGRLLADGSFSCFILGQR